MILSVCAATLPYAQPPGTYDTSARRGPGGCGWPVAIARAHEDPALSPARPCAAPHRVPCGAPAGGRSRTQPPQARTARARRARRARAGRPYDPLHPHSRAGHRVRLRVKSSPCCWLINNPPHQNLRHLRAAPRRGLERAAAGPPGSRTASATVAVRALGPYMALERKPEASTTRASPHRMAHTKAHPAPHEWAKVRV